MQLSFERVWPLLVLYQQGAVMKTKTRKRNITHVSGFRCCFYPRRAWTFNNYNASRILHELWQSDGPMITLEVGNGSFAKCPPMESVNKHLLLESAFLVCRSCCRTDDHPAYSFESAVEDRKQPLNWNCLLRNSEWTVKHPGKILKNIFAVQALKHLELYSAHRQPISSGLSLQQSIRVKHFTRFSRPGGTFITYPRCHVCPH